MSKALPQLRRGLLLASAASIGIAWPVWAQSPVAPQTNPTAQVGTAEAGSAPADADLTSQSASGNNLEEPEIVVTAQKRVERLQDVPLAVTALSGDQLAQRQTNDTQGLVQAVPSLSFQQGSNPTNTTFRVRGVGTTLFSQGVEPSVSVVVDGVVSARQAQSFVDFADLERIEVLRGPQGTLFGRNSTAGVIHIITARPSRDFEGRFEASIAEMDEYRIKGTVSGPISDTVGARVTGYYNSVGGYLNNVTTGGESGGNEGYGVRGKLEWDVTRNLNFLLSADYRKSNAACCRTLLFSTQNPSLAALYAPVVATFRNRDVLENVPTSSSTEQATFSAQGDWDLGGATVTSITAYQSFDNYAQIDNDSLNTPVPLYVGGGNNPAKYDDQSGTVKLHNFTQELRVGSDGSRDLTYVAGVFYSKLDLDRTFRRRRAVCATGLLGQPCAAAATTFQSAQHVAELSQESIAAFGQAEYSILDGLKAIGGLRVQYEKVSVRGSRTAPILPGDVVFPAHNPGSGFREANDTAVTGKAGLQYEFSRYAQIYGTYTRGYKGLGFDTEITADFANQLAVQPEHVNAYEIGFKGRTADNKLSVAAALFLANYSNLQVQANRSDVNTGVVTFVQTNAGSTRTKGFEIEATLRPSSSFSVDAAVTYIDSSVDVDGLNCPLQFQAAAPVLTDDFPVNSCYRRRFTAPTGTVITSGPIQDIRGGTLPAAPRWRINLSPRYEHDLPGTKLAGFVQVNLNFQSRQQFAIEQDSLLVQDAYALVDMSVGVSDQNGSYTLTMFVENLFDENYTTNLQHGTLLASTASPFDIYGQVNKDANRYFGATLGVRF
ncbi:TonB-dependent receptor [Allosphingosinicella deserti]|uniref:TonB-dependent receptor n=1 Tax=Allosphingosinicella deserti TaxID=2116704 RepID=A0A2P7QZP9_9SPHN|nr:TonB-dependent receptor [Sphingomonas deserti]PSJ43438.1 TonB-dependent receptor [Sphingomonas deserti]